jgi:hypothetical protein
MKSLPHFPQLSCSESSLRLLSGAEDRIAVRTCFVANCAKGFEAELATAGHFNSARPLRYRLPGWHEDSIAEFAPQLFEIDSQNVGCPQDKTAVRAIHLYGSADSILNSELATAGHSQSLSGRVAARAHVIENSIWNLRVLCGLLGQ